MVEQRPVHNSEVYLISQPPFPAIPPPSPPSPITPADDELCSPITRLSLDEPAIAICDERLLALEGRLSTAVHVIHTQTTALQCVTALYSTDRTARDGFSRAVEAITRRQGDKGRHGKLVVIGVGKSGHIAKKLVATFNSLAIQAVFLHPTEALHGDLGQIGPNDTLLLITFSGKTPELLTLLPHLDKALPLILLTSHTRPDTCELIRYRPDTILLPAPIHEPETKSFGVSAPTTSTTVAITIGDALAIVASQELHPSVASVFAKNHPGGAIGAALRRPHEDTVRHLAVPLDEVAYIDPAPSTTTTGADVLRAGYASPSGWVGLKRSGGGVVSPSQIRRLSSADLVRCVHELGWMVTSKSDYISIAANTTVRSAAEWIRSALRGEVGCTEHSVIAVMENGECIGLLEVGTLLEAASAQGARFGS
ncbi:hypothetical protein B0T22DRAFT_502429 [Podospora appendiculata]|uniref:SIS domain-containing protein n=1 Tax=Podospora appendiculata TaxID=314037 RepID=A0AAE0WZM1_9PEZI|nr:hypothetical protein B0T22DRAFT_502429 [Podospora appendiculata]